MQPFFPLALSPGDFSLYISRKKTPKLSSSQSHPLHLQNVKKDNP